MTPGCKETDYLEIDHVIPLSRGGSHAVDNFQLLCASCNGSKYVRLGVDYRPANVSLESLSA